MSEKSTHNLLPSTQWKPYWSLRDFLMSVCNSGTVTQMHSSCWYFSTHLSLNIFFILLLCCISLHSVTSRCSADNPMQYVWSFLTTGADMNQNNIERYLNGCIWFCIVFQCWTRTKWDWVFLDVFWHGRLIWIRMDEPQYNFFLNAALCFWIISDDLNHLDMIVMIRTGVLGWITLLAAVWKSGKWKSHNAGFNNKTPTPSAAKSFTRTRRSMDSCFSLALLNHLDSMVMIRTGVQTVKVWKLFVKCLL